jgi:cysteinyl-tRNA synthetase
MDASDKGLRFFNTLTRHKEIFIPLKEGKVRMYTCGPTVWDYAHIGNFRAFLFEDLLKRWLEYHGFKVSHVMNLTDVDDKTIRGSQKKNIPLDQYTEHFAKAFFEDIKALNIRLADHYPKATEHIPEMVSLIKKLLVKGCAYKGEDGSVYYSVKKFRNYGKLSGIKLKELKIGARVKSDEYTKEEAQDFALWKAWTLEDKDVYWETDLGKGRPGWHIECSAMSMHYLGETLDIHCGGIDNIFPHHENEIAQSEAATGKKFVRYWMHNEHLLVEGKKMAKKFGNFYTLRDLLSQGFDPITIRYLLLSTHYRQQLNFTFEGLESAKGAVERLRNFVRRLRNVATEERPASVVEMLHLLKENFSNAMDDDLNISVALGFLFDFVRDVNNLIDEGALAKGQAEAIAVFMADIDKVLGVIGEFKNQTLSEEAEKLIAEREEARKVKDWETADKLRIKLKDIGVIVEDTSSGPKWHLSND